MTASNTASGAAKSAPTATSLAPALRDLGQAALRYAAAKTSRQLEDWSDDLNSLVASGGPTTQAVVEGVQAKLGGKNPVWAAIKGAWSRSSTKQKLAVIVILVVTLLLAPVLLLVLGLVLLVAALVARIRATAR